MYNEYFGLKESPFSIAPDPRYLYMSEQHREALAHLIYGFNSDGGFVLLTGEVGTGKTTVCRCLLEQVPENSAIAFILNPKLTAEELLATICDEFGITYPSGNTSIKVFIDLINAYLLDAHSRGSKAVLIIDEAQNLSSDVLEQLRLLTNLETNKQKLLQIILLGQPELRDKLSRPELRQLSQRIIARYHLGSLARKDVGSYVSHRLAVAGLHDSIFTDSTMDKLFHLSGGVPRLINVICDRALLGAYAQGKNRVRKDTLKKAAREVFGETRMHGPHKKVAAWIFPVMVLLIVGAVLAATYYKNDVRDPVSSPSLDTVETGDITDSLPAVNAALDDLAWPDYQPVETSIQLAFQELFKLWDIEYNPDGAVFCEQVQTHGLQCLNGLGSLNNLRQINRPAIIKMINDENAAYYIVLKSLNKTSAAVLVGTEIREISIGDVESLWSGDYTIIWKRPPGYQGDIHPGMQNSLVPWIDEQLAAVQGRSTRSPENMVMNEDLVEQVRRFQLTAGLIPDGIVGTHTIIHMNSVADSNIPRLIMAREGK